MKEPVLKIKIEGNGESVSLECEHGQVLMIPFRGTVDCDLFHGIVLPIGVDTQLVNAVHVRHMSARYMLEGTDPAGQNCHIYIENNGWFDDLHKTMPFHTIPTFYTDSKLLAPYLHRNQFVGEGSVEEDGLWIRFYELDYGCGGADAKTAQGDCLPETDA